MSDTPADLVRLSKRMSELGLCSRREADEWISKGWVKVDGQVVSELGSKVRPDQKITIDRKAKDQQNERVTIILNKPLGYVSGQAEDGHEPARILITPRNRWIDDPSPRRFNPSQLKGRVPAGRLEINSTGLLCLTQDGRIAKTIIGENSSVEKEYIVRVAMTDGRSNSEFPPAKLALLNHGLELDGKPLEKAEVSWLNEDQLKFVLREGRNRQIRRMCDLVGLKVLALKRVRVGNVRLGKLPVGKWRYLEDGESFTGPAPKRASSSRPAAGAPRRPKTFKPRKPNFRKTRDE
ncbi:pseudouridine synthase [Parasutterella excrementihominis]|uniref:pseudouridine synthase n=1 Tax=Parasutterella excrementihominis TaxID=487175 RepID=UPI00242F0832|nr:pseudouridine synthase [Parasutterella excrementihominis]